jgi:hypothetical protein
MKLQVEVGNEEEVECDQLYLYELLHDAYRCALVLGHRERKFRPGLRLQTFVAFEVVELAEQQEE